MARYVDHLAGPLSDEDREYLLNRGRRHLVIQNERMFSEEGEGTVNQGHRDEDEVDWDAEVNAMTVPELKEELEARGESTQGNKADLQRRLIDLGPAD